MTLIFGGHRQAAAEWQLQRLGTGLGIWRVRSLAAAALQQSALGHGQAECVL